VAHHGTIGVTVDRSKKVGQTTITLADAQKQAARIDVIHDYANVREFPGCYVVEIA
jgi:hypothetical protein